MKTFYKSALASAAVFTTSYAQAAIDVTDLVTEVEGLAAPVALIAMAVLTVIVGIKGFKMLRRAL
jgi:hypothetical protein